MPHLLIKDLPRYECLIEAAKEFPDLDPSSTEAYLHVLHAGDELAGVAERSLARFSMSQGRFGVLMLLWKGGDSPSERTQCGCAPAPRTPAELAEAAGVTRATMTGLVDTLERDGLVKREPDPDDRRMMSVRLTPKAEKFMEQYLPGHFKLISGLMAPLTETERRTLVRLLGKIQDHIPAGTDAAAPFPATA
jgi:DNA-binding MarR family transcriptional regulator